MCSPLGFHLIIITQQTFPCLDRMPRVCSSTAPAMLHSTCQQFQRKPHDSPNCEPGPSSKTHYPGRLLWVLDRGIVRLPRKVQGLRALRQKKNRQTPQPHNGLGFGLMISQDVPSISILRGCIFHRKDTPGIAQVLGSLSTASAVASGTPDGSWQGKTTKTTRNAGKGSLSDCPTTPADGASSAWPGKGNRMFGPTTAPQL